MAAVQKGQRPSDPGVQGAGMVEQSPPQRVSVKAGLVYGLASMAVVFGVLIIVFQVLMTGTEAVIGLGIMGAGLGLGAVAVFMPPPKAAAISELAERKGPGIKGYMFGVSLGLFVVGVILQPPISSRGISNLFSQDLSSLLFLFLFAFSFLMYIEMGTSSFRFMQIKQYAELQRLQDLELNSAMGWNMGMSIAAGLATLIITAGIFMIMGVFWNWAPVMIKNSIEFNSIYGLILIAAVVFGLFAIAYSFIFGWEGYQRSIRAFRKKEGEEEEEEEILEEE